MKNLEIGKVVLQYDEKGKVTYASFEPTMKVELDENLSKQLQTIPSNSDSSVIQYNAQMMLGSFFSKMNEIELADRDHYIVDSEVIECTKYESGTAKNCIIKFVFKELNT